MEEKQVRKNIINSLTLVLSIHAAAMADSLDDKIHDTLMVTPRQIDTSWINSENQASVVQRLRDTNNNYGLLLLGDALTEQKMATLESQGDEEATSDIMYAAQASFIQYIIPETYSTKPAPPSQPRSAEPGADVETIYIPQNLGAASLICRIIRRTKAFSQATRDWANSGQVYGAAGVPRVQQWWEHNKEAILAHNYSEATWLPPVEELNASSPAADSWTNLEPRASTPDGAPHLIAEISANNGAGILWPLSCAIVILASVFALAYLLFSKKR